VNDVANALRVNSLAPLAASPSQRRYRQRLLQGKHGHAINRGCQGIIF
jgi:hypothetical protein